LAPFSIPATISGPDGETSNGMVPILGMWGEEAFSGTGAVHRGGDHNFPRSAFLHDNGMSSRVYHEVARELVERLTHMWIVWLKARGWS
jgi:hypothetical protein